MSGVDLRLLDGELAVARLDRGASPPEWARPGAGGIASVTVTGGETSVVCDPESIPAGVRCSPGWRALVVAGTLDHTLTGVLASLAVPLADAGVPIFAVSTFDTDFILVPGARVGAALDALRGVGHRIDVGGAAG